MVEKAFDKVRHPFTIKTLNRLEMEGNYINILIAILICEKSAANILSGKILKLAFLIKSGTREGYPLLSLLFNIMLEVSSQQLNKKKTFKLERRK